MTNRLLALAAFVLWTACASSPQVTVDHDPGTDFTGFHTWALLPPDASDEPTGYGAGEDGLLDQRIQRALVAELTARGLEQVPADRADLLVATHVTSETRLSVSNTGPQIGVSRGYRHWGYAGAASTQTTVREYEYGTLIIDLVARADMQLVWRGSSRSRVRRSGTPDEREQRVRDAVRGILSRYPPVAGD